MGWRVIRLTRLNDGKEPIMSKFTIAGLVLWFSSGLLLGYQALQAFINSGINSGGTMAWKKLTLMDVIGKNYFSWINGMSEGIVHNITQYIVTMPLSLLLFCVGILFIILGRLTSKL
jgi:hypothetical protein